MKIQPINNSKNISHKAYFKPNKIFNGMYGKYGKTLSKETIAKLKNLPEHKLEMIEIRNYERGLEVDIFNTFTQKALTFGITKKNPFESLINQMSLDSSKDFFTEDALNIMNYMSITMPTLYKKNTKL